MDGFLSSVGCATAIGWFEDEFNDVSTLARERSLLDHTTLPLTSAFDDEGYVLVTAPDPAVVRSQRGETCP